MNKEVCKRFKNVWDAFPDTLDNNKNYQFNDFVPLNNDCNHNKFSNNYCNNNNNNNFPISYCNDNKIRNDLDKISAGCLYLLDEFIKDCGVVPPPAKNNINIVDYILIWLSYMLNLKISEEEQIITCFYSEYIHGCDRYNTKINEITDYDSYKDLLDKKNDVLNMDSNYVPKFYEAFKSLCNLYNELDDEKKNCKNYLNDNNEFFKKYEKLKNDSDIADKSPYKEILFTLSTDYDNLKNECNDTSSSTSTETLKNSEQRSVESFKQFFAEFGEDLGQEFGQGFGHDSESDSEHFSEVTPSSSSIVSKLIPVLLIFGAIGFFLGISYKYSLFGFRKRSQKQQIKEKLKK
ncbi:hypothetical protein YYC_05863 [Plasmodium yoelii 17X]|uniref:PIR protein n=3 Tax=Plasmodium yoelii TaxID=5861 RepID=A0AAE9WT10_PLAYO|nr:PIR protein [Plasmodium yoelii]ETB56102.1 hypothetical protein YYC_05863 [Plasmodium yoelii 17X]WBY59572.1 PIR protein [Plasmodium yoelii yoelii]VTZ80314.1 PIR protein [Plasmodium yoelii]|eukprot:XP_022812775.1 PIR protein [Plasmodium yoelii]